MTDPKLPLAGICLFGTADGFQAQGHGLLALPLNIAGKLFDRRSSSYPLIQTSNDKLFIIVPINQEGKVFYVVGQIDYAEDNFGRPGLIGAACAIRGERFTSEALDYGLIWIDEQLSIAKSKCLDGLQIKAANFEGLLHPPLSKQYSQVDALAHENFPEHEFLTLPDGWMRKFSVERVLRYCGSITAFKMRSICFSNNDSYTSSLSIFARDLENLDEILGRQNFESRIVGLLKNLEKQETRVQSLVLQNSQITDEKQKLERRCESLINNERSWADERRNYEQIIASLKSRDSQSSHNSPHASNGSTSQSNGWTSGSTRSFDQNQGLSGKNVRSNALESEQSRPKKRLFLNRRNVVLGSIFVLFVIIIAMLFWKSNSSSDSFERLAEIERKADVLDDFRSDIKSNLEKRLNENLFSKLPSEDDFDFRINEFSTLTDAHNQIIDSYFTTRNSNGELSEYSAQGLTFIVEYNLAQKADINTIGDDNCIFEMEPLGTTFEQRSYETFKSKLIDYGLCKKKAN